jgi:tetratricopeptide (TPR) repeat protein
VHALVRDAAYGQLPRSSRAELHLAAAEWIESLPEDRAEDRAETVAHHYLTAIELRRAAGDGVDDVAEPARRALQEAGERAYALSAFRAADRFLSRALELVPAGEEPSPELLLAAGQAAGIVGREGDELAGAVDAFERAGEPERAAEAAVVASWNKWHSKPVEARAWLERAAALVEGRLPSRAKALVVAENARRAMLGYQYSTAIELADEAVALAQEIGDVEIQADALVTGGSARASSGQQDGIPMLEGALELVGHRGRVASRGYTNLGVAQGTFGDLEASKATFELGLERAMLEGDEQGTWFIRGNLLGGRVSAGDWDGALELVEMFLAADDFLSYQKAAAHGVRAVILEARGDRVAAGEDDEAGIRLSRENDDAQSLWPALISSSWLRRRQGRRDEASALLEEVVQAIAESESAGDPQEWQILLAMELVIADRDEGARELAARLPEGTWHDACLATAERRYVDAADILDAMGEQVLQADLRLLAARALAADGKLVDAERQLELARAFWRSVGAIAFLRETDGVVAEAG